MLHRDLYKEDANEMCTVMKVRGEKKRGKSSSEPDELLARRKMPNYHRDIAKPRYIMKAFERHD